MPEPLTIRVDRNLAEVARVTGRLEALCQEQRLPEEASMDVLLCVEEVLSNVIRHGCPAEGEDEVWVHAGVRTEEIEIQVEDGGPAFDPLSYPQPRLDLPIQERQMGGLGIHLVRSLMDRISYQRTGGKNYLTMSKKIHRKNQP